MVKALIPVRVPAGSSQQRSSSQGPVATLPVSPRQPRLALSVAAAAAAARAISTWLTQLDKKKKKKTRLLYTALLFKASCTFTPPAIVFFLFVCLFLSRLLSYSHLPLLPLDAQLLGRGASPLPVSRCCGVRRGARRGAGCQCASLCLAPGYGLAQEELLSPASMQYSLPSPLGSEPYWQEVSSLDCAPIATTEEDTLMEMSDVQVWPSGNSPSLVPVEDSSLECSNADDSEGLLGLPYGSLGRPASQASAASGGGGLLSGSIELPEDDSEMGVDSLSNATPASLGGTIAGMNLNGLNNGQGSEASSEASAFTSTPGGDGGGGGREGMGLAEGLSLVAGQQRVYARLSESPGLGCVADRNCDR